MSFNAKSKFGISVYVGDIEETLGVDDGIKGVTQFELSFMEEGQS